MSHQENSQGREELSARLTGTAWKLLNLEVTHSTNDVAKEAAHRGAGSGLVVVANEQTAGRGRVGRTWYSPAGEGLYVSILIKPTFAARFAGRLGILAAVAVADAVEKACGLRPKIKWPNDLLIDGKKLGGILVETELVGERIEYAVIGIGINISSQRMPDELADRATSLLLATDKTVRREDVLIYLLQAIERRLGQDFREVRVAWESGCDLVSKQVEMRTAEGVVKGTVLGLNEDGSLILETAAGSVQTVSSGEMNFIR